MISPLVRWMLPIVVVPLALAGCSGSSSAGAAGTSGPDATDSAAAGLDGATAATAAAPTRLPSAGCAPNHVKIPATAGKAKSVDLDHDGKRDTLWLADSGTTRGLGVHTASGATFSTVFTSAAPQAASAIGQRLGDGTEIILLNTGRSVALYAVIDCKIVPAQNLQDKQYTFDLGFTGFGTGVRCLNTGRGLELAGMLAEQKGSKYTVYRTRIAMSEEGRQARNVPRETLAKSASASSSLVKAAHGVSCGTKNPAVDEPQG